MPHCVSTDCGGRIKGEKGTIKSPNYPSPYPTGVTCRWIVEAPKSKIVVLDFKSIDIEKSKKCRYDSVEVLDGGTVRSFFSFLVSHNQSFWVGGGGGSAGGGGNGVSTARPVHKLPVTFSF